MGRIQVIDFMLQKDDVYQGIIKYIDEKKLNVSDANRILILVDLDIIGENDAVNTWLKSEMRHFTENKKCFFSDKIASIVVRSSTAFYTKQFAKKFIWMTNHMGCEWIGHPLVELTESYNNLNTWSLSIKAPKEVIAHQLIVSLIERLEAYAHLAKDNLNVLVLHASHQKLSNTFMLWEKVRAQLEKLEPLRVNYTILQLNDGVITDCNGCDFDTCSYFGLQKNCFYGGFVVEDLYPKFELADYVVLVCPNYNDSISAKIMAVINRLSALYRNVSLRDKYLLGVVVSANSGSDVVASQILGALCINKGLRLPPQFSVYATANAPGDLNKDPLIDDSVESYVNILFENMNKNINKF